jgi:toxin ParE1/3/4
VKPLVVEDDADAELRAAIIRYEEERPGLGAQFWDEIQRTLALIQERPGIGERVRRARVKGIARRFPVRRFPYFVIYREHPELIEIIAFAHHRQRPGYWRARGR